MTTAQEMKRFFKDWAQRNDLEVIHRYSDEQPGTAMLIKRQGKFSVQVGIVADPTTQAYKAGLTTGWEYPLLNATENEATDFFAHN